MSYLHGDDGIDFDYAEKLFVWAYCDLGRTWDVVRQHSDDQIFEMFNSDKSYLFLNMARLVRQLINDKHSLADVANRRFRRKLRFFVSEYGSSTDDDIAALEKAKPYIPDPEMLPPGNYWKAVKLDTFLRSSSLTLGGGGPDGAEHFTVTNSDLIDYFANCAGGVHLAPYMERARITQLRRFDLQFIVGDNGMVEAALGNMIAATLRALGPLYAEVTKFHETRVASIAKDGARSI